MWWGTVQRPHHPGRAEAEGEGRTAQTEQEVVGRLRRVPRHQRTKGMLPVRQRTKGMLPVDGAPKRGFLFPTMSLL